MCPDRKAKQFKGLTESTGKIENLQFNHTFFPAALVMPLRTLDVRKRKRAKACLILTVACTGCTNRPPPPVPAMVALSVTSDYGFSETAVAPDQYTVSFISPSLSAHGDPDQDYGLAGEKERVYDLALWRTAQIALERGYPAFEVQSESRDVDVFIAEPPPAPPYLPAGLRTISGPPCRWNCERPIGYWGDPYFNPIYDDWYRRAHSSGRVTATLMVKMLTRLVDGAHDAAATAERLHRMYASSTFDVR